MVLGVWLILTGLLPFLNAAIPYKSTVLSVLALLAGVLLLLGR